MRHVYQFILSAVASILLLMLFCVKLHSNIKSRTCNKFNTYSAIAIFFFGVTCTCLALLSATNDYGILFIRFVDIDIFSHVLLYRGAWTAWSFGSVFCYLSFIYRLNTVFKESTYALSWKLIYLFYILISLFFILESASTTCYILYYFDTIDIQKYEIYHLIIVILQEIVDFILTVFLIKLFVDKLFGILLMTVSSPNDMIDDKLTNHHNRLIDVITKYTILGFPAIISTQIFLLIDLLFIIIILITNDAKFQIIADTHFLPFVWILECITNALCLFLNSKDTKIWYQLLCARCHLHYKYKNIQKAKCKISLQMTQSLEEPLITEHDISDMHCSDINAKR